MSALALHGPVVKKSHRPAEWAAQHKTFVNFTSFFLNWCGHFFLQYPFANFLQNFSFSLVCFYRSFTNILKHRTALHNGFVSLGVSVDGGLADASLFHSRWNSVFWDVVSDPYCFFSTNFCFLTVCLTSVVFKLHVYHL